MVYTMKIAVIGAGNIGGTLGKKWADSGNLVYLGVRDPASTRIQALLREISGNAIALSIAEALAEGEAVLLAVPGRIADETVRAHASELDGKIVIDATNKIGDPLMNCLTVLAEECPRAVIYRAFNNLGWENFVNPTFNGEQADLFYCGTDDPARQKVETLIRATGLRPIYCGGPDQAAVIDNLTALWINLATRMGMGRHLALKLLAD
jgi:8-hydroxy-5-deazaflavin:NADPH oxidoreductase